MTISKTKRATYADIEALPSHVIGEILFGVLHTQPRPARRHVATASVMGGVAHLWYVEPVGQTLEVFQAQGENWLLTHTFVSAETVSAPPFDAISFQLSDFWPFDTPIDLDGN